MSDNVAVLINNNTIGMQVAKVIQHLPVGHNRAEAFRLIREANIKNSDGKPISPSMYYHYVCYVIRADGLPLIKTLNPHFVPTESPYSKPKELSTPVKKEPLAAQLKSGEVAVTRRRLSELLLQAENTANIIRDIIANENSEYKPQRKRG